MNKQLQIERIEQFLNDHGIDPTETDIPALVDGSLHFDENFSKIKEKFGVKSEEELMEEIRNWEEREQKKRKEEFRNRFENSLKQVERNGKQVSQYYSQTRAYVKAIVNGGPDSLILFSRPGLGKSYQVLSVLKEEGLEKDKDYALISGYSTPLSLYHKLYRNRDKIVVLDDVDGITSSRKALSLLQAVTWSVNGERIVNYETTSDKLEAPSQFEFEGSIIICLNRASSLPELEALRSNVEEDE
ncbi:hypothetical protein AKJ66_01480 [candidate division MSBL1 archaeon SCGC-AAA259E22]|uniref:Uncharacterized protein n=1 Tax=candidate division MSBL1 archaeon SCGC-AAA259E22 TaxID=1698265 RepID=A0A133UHJ5_9EURY|nr:hypothetical protein AKJ66_01480 [candidate division MSBL1 archaeon SCGC-AAA259E22]